MANFRPDLGQGGTLTAGTTSASLTVPRQAPTFRIVNAGPSAAFIRWGFGAQTATVTDLYLPVGNTEVFDKAECNTISAITSSGAASLYVSIGTGQ